MKAIVLALLILAVFAEERITYHYDGKIVVNNEPAVTIEGPFFTVTKVATDHTLIAGMHIKADVHTPFGFQAKITSFKKDGDKIEVKGACNLAAWGRSTFAVKGEVIISGTIQKATYTGWCYRDETKTNYTISAEGIHRDCWFYTPEEGAKRVQFLIGESVETYHAVHVVNYATIGYPYLGPVQSCKYYLDNVKNATGPKAGFVIVGKDGAHCAIIDKEGDKFVHSNPQTKKVGPTPMNLIDTFFKNGYVFKDYTCPK